MFLLSATLNLYSKTRGPFLTLRFKWKMAAAHTCCIDGAAMVVLPIYLLRKCHSRPLKWLSLIGWSFSSTILLFSFLSVPPRISLLFCGRGSFEAARWNPKLVSHVISRSCRYRSYSWMARNAKIDWCLTMARLGWSMSWYVNGGYFLLEGG